MSIAFSAGVLVAVVGLVSSTSPAAGDSPAQGPRQCFAPGQVSQVIGLHQPGIKRACWEQAPTTKRAVNVNVSFEIKPDGSTSGVFATSDEASVASCVADDVRTWHFPAMGCWQPVSFTLHFVREPVPSTRPSAQ